MKALAIRNTNPHAAPGRDARRPGRVHATRGFVLPIVLMILILLALLGASFAFEMHADVAGTRATMYRMQTRAAAEAGIQRVTVLLRDQRLDVDAWYNNREELHRVLVWQDGEDPTAFGRPPAADTEDVPAFRFSIVADDPANDEIGVRYGITNEAAKLNINLATVEQLRTLIAQVVPPDAPVEELADALMDWRDADDTPNENGAEREYYLMLDPPYQPKNGPFDTVEELLMVKGFTAQVLYGEDYDRNGLLTINENDGDESFPLDDGDGELNKGLYPFITVWSRDFNTASDNKPRVYIGPGAPDLSVQLEEFFAPEEIAFIQAAAARGAAAPKGGGDGSKAPTGSGSPTGGGDAEKTGTGGDGFGTNGAPDDGSGTDGSGDSGAFDSLIDLLKPIQTGDGFLPSPFELEDLPLILDRLSLDPRPERAGMIDVNTAPAEVLRCVPGMTQELIGELIAQRETLDSEEKATPAWILVNQLTDDATMELLIHNITARGYQFTIESLGYADHIGTVSRLQVAVEMRGPVAQTIYYRDLTPLGIGFPIRLKDEEEGGTTRVSGSG